MIFFGFSYFSMNSRMGKKSTPIEFLKFLIFWDTLDGMEYIIMNTLFIIVPDTS